VEDPQERVRRSYDISVAIISAALRRSNPEMTPAELYKIRGFTSQQMREASDAILQYSGLMPKAEGSAAGEAAGAA
jgi:hypothetical protein